VTVVGGRDSYPGPDLELAGRVLGRALRGGGDAADLFVEERHSLSLRLEDGRIENALSGSDLGGSIRVISGLSTVFGYTDAVEEDALLRLAGELSRPRARRSDEVLSMSAQRAGRRQRVRVDPVEIAVAAKAALLHLADETARGASGEIRQVVVSYGESRQKVWIAGSHGRVAADDRRGWPSRSR